MDGAAREAIGKARHDAHRSAGKSVAQHAAPIARGARNRDDPCQLGRTCAAAGAKESKRFGAASAADGSAAASALPCV